MKPGPVATEQLRRIDATWGPGEHVLISGPTGSGKTTIAQHLVQMRVNNRGYAVVFVMKPNVDETITREYKGWTRWKKWNGRPTIHENRILLWPDTSKDKGARAILEHQRDVFGNAVDDLIQMGKMTVQVDEGLYMCDPQFLNMSSELAMMHAIGRSGGLTCVTLCQRPANLPLILYGSASHAILGQTRELQDMKRLSHLGGRNSAKELGGMMGELSGHEFLWVPTRVGMEPEILDLSK